MFWYSALQSFVKWEFRKRPDKNFLISKHFVSAISNIFLVGSYILPEFFLWIENFQKYQMKSSWALGMFCLPYSFLCSRVQCSFCGTKNWESDNYKKNMLELEPPEIKTNQFMLSFQELSLIFPNSRFGPILSKVDKILITIWTYLELGNIHNYWHDYCCLNNADLGFDFKMRLMKIQNSNKILDHSVALYLILYFHYPE